MVLLEKNRKCANYPALVLKLITVFYNNSLRSLLICSREEQSGFATLSEVIFYLFIRKKNATKKIHYMMLFFPFLCCDELKVSPGCLIQGAIFSLPLHCEINQNGNNMWFVLQASRRAHSHLSIN